MKRFSKFAFNSDNICTTIAIIILSVMLFLAFRPINYTEIPVQDNKTEHVSGGYFQNIIRLD